MRAAINTPIQGSAADVATAAMLSIAACPELRALGWTMLLQVRSMVLTHTHGAYSYPPWGMSKQGFWACPELHALGISKLLPVLALRCKTCGQLACCVPGVSPT